MNTFTTARRLLVKVSSLLAITVLSLSMTQTSFSANTTANTRVRLQTSMGVIVVELDAARAPLTVANFLDYVRSGFYNGTIFHRVIPGFVVQGGGYTPQNVEKPTKANVVNESGNGLSNRHGTIAMARTGDPHSANAQFYINLADNVALDPQPNRWGYAVFGRVVEGIDVAQKIGDTPTGVSGPFSDAPIKQVIIEKAEVMQ